MATSNGTQGGSESAGKQRSAPPVGLGLGGSTPVSFSDPPGILRDRGPEARKWNTDVPNILPHERVFPIQIGNELFRLSGASISSDAPSYFSQFFLCQLKQAEESGEENTAVRTLYIDRDPVTFGDIARHLQGYHVQPRDGAHFVKLFADASFYSLPRLISQLHEENIFISIGNRDFQIPRELFSDPGNSPNYFSLGFAVFFSTPTELFPGLNRENLLRPPSIMPPSVPNRSADIFAELIHLLRGYPIEIRNEEHRTELVRDCRYFHLRGLEQKLIRHHISFNLARQRQEICLRLEDVRQSGISIGPPSFPTISSSSTSGSYTPPFSGYVNYARPFVDDKSYELVLEIGSECTRLHFSSTSQTNTTRAEFFGEAKKRITRLFEVVATKMGLGGTSQPLGLLMKNGGASSQPASPGNTPLSEDWVRVYLEPEAYVLLDGKPWSESGKRTQNEESRSSSIHEIDLTGSPSRKRRRGEDERVLEGEVEGEESWIVKRGQWRLRVQHKSGGKGPVECVLVAVKLDAVSGEYGRNAERGFLGG